MITRVKNAEGFVEVHFNVRSVDEIREEYINSHKETTDETNTIKNILKIHKDEINEIISFLKSIRIFWKNRKPGDPVYGYFDDSTNKYIDEIICYDEDTRLKLSPHIASIPSLSYIYGAKAMINQPMYFLFNISTTTKKLPNGTEVECRTLRDDIGLKVKNVCKTYYNRYAKDTDAELEAHCFSGLYLGKSVKKIINALMPSDHDVFVKHHSEFKNQDAAKVVSILEKCYFKNEDIINQIDKFIKEGKIGNGIKDILDISQIEVMTSGTAEYIKSKSSKYDIGDIFDGYDNPTNIKSAKYLSKIDVLIPIDSHFRDLYPNRIIEVMKKYRSDILHYVTKAIYCNSDFKATYNDLSLFTNTFTGYDGTYIKFIFELKSVG